MLLASASNAIIIGFNVRPDRNAADMAEREEVDIRLHSVIYNVTDEIQKGMEGLLEPTFKEVRIGDRRSARGVQGAEDRRRLPAAWSPSGRITRAGETQARLLRDNVVVHEGKIGLAAPLQGRRERSEVRASSAASASSGFNDIKVGDVIEVFTMEKVAAATAVNAKSLAAFDCLIGSGTSARSRRRADPRGAERPSQPRRRCTIRASASSR